MQDFPGKKFKIFDVLYIISGVILQCNEKLEIGCKATFKRFFEFYQDDLPNHQILDSEIDK